MKKVGVNRYASIMTNREKATAFVLHGDDKDLAIRVSNANNELHLDEGKTYVLRSYLNVKTKFSDPKS